MPNKYSVLFVCLGNICRSPLAEGIFRELVRQRGLEKEFCIASCGTGSWHEGEPAHRESRRVATQNGIDLSGHSARQLCAADFTRFSWHVAMDCQNKRDIMHAAAGRPVLLHCLREFDAEAESLDVPDPFYGGRDGFEEVYRIIERSCHGLLDHILQDDR